MAAGWLPAPGRLTYWPDRSPRPGVERQQDRQDATHLGRGDVVSDERRVPNPSRSGRAAHATWIDGYDPHAGHANHRGHGQVHRLDRMRRGDGEAVRSVLPLDDNVEPGAVHCDSPGDWLGHHAVPGR